MVFDPGSIDVMMTKINQVRAQILMNGHQSCFIPRREASLIMRKHALFLYRKSLIAFYFQSILMAP